MAQKAIGIDIGGTGIKGAVVNIKTGELVSERLRVETPAGGRPAEIAESVKGLIERLAAKKPNLPVGICFPAVVVRGTTMSAANISDEWIGLDADALFTKALGRSVHVLNDADAAGIAEIRFGAGRDSRGLTIMTTLGTGIGTALFLGTKLVPNAELGHLQIEGMDYETQAAFSAKEREALSWGDWAVRLQKYYSHLEALLSPDLIIVGGGVSKDWQQFLPLLNLRTKIVPAEKRNSAGILGAAAMAYKYQVE